MEGIVWQKRLALFHFLKTSNQRTKVDFKYREIYGCEQILDCTVIGLRNSDCNKVLVEIIYFPLGQAGRFPVNKDEPTFENRGILKTPRSIYRSAQGKGSWNSFECCLLRDKDLRLGRNTVVTWEDLCTRIWEVMRRKSFALRVRVALVEVSSIIEADETTAVTF